MNLTIANPECENYDNFVQWLCIYLKDYGMKIYNRNEVLESEWDKYFEENDWGWPKDDSGTPRAPRTSYILSTYFSNLRPSKENGRDYVIKCRDDAILRDTDLKIDMLASAINYGSASMPPAYPFIDKVFDNAALALPELYEDIYLKSKDEPE